MRLQENDCRNRGYILDGYPRNHYDCQNVFLKAVTQPDPDDPDNAEARKEYEPEEADEENPVKVFPEEWFKPNEAIFPSSVILLQQDDSFLVDRVKNLDEEVVAGTHYNLADMKRRLKTGTAQLCSVSLRSAGFSSSFGSLAYETSVHLALLKKSRTFFSATFDSLTLRYFFKRRFISAKL